MRVYATTEQLAGEPWNVTPTNPDRLLLSASLIIDRAVLLAWYAVDAAGMPTDTAVAGALRDATCAQVAAWAALGIDPAKGAANEPKSVPVASKGLGSARIEYDRGSTQDRATAQSARAAIATGLAPEAAQILASANLYGQVWTYG